MQPIEFLYVSKLANREHKSIWNSLKTSLASMIKEIFRVKMVRVDGEGSINTEGFHNKDVLRGTVRFPIISSFCDITILRLTFYTQNDDNRNFISIVSVFFYLHIFGFSTLF